ncbi:XRE family transcriptional regulator [Streptomyces violaceusniger]|uniref:Helix-turn-helix domain-containing protein n=2 Tax=Streptomyces violaceusniger group TaxID=2839105 RepID=A0ABD5JE72_9ACTN|nr:MULTISPECIES: helix-turn-helix transcriptional regulator [Streptomyces]MEE4585948.1 helix-turn-helix domain-containing protein [Streptomyces sp. DSM 41602]KUL65061.1 XRE family transcriptional regulator [Streptomyces violaceusniger]RSS49039.1 helix-turn-helix domain-containing protein [Streptomyces sp. WAC05858]WTA86965.1 helix-turn-helix domain-containing protein [Streptomyces antimycoticus]WTB11803.1 helix-turn-helix domain-containing protein [Streptomyces antimycoticus]
MAPGGSEWRSRPVTEDEAVLQNVGPRLRGFRKALGVTLAELAERTGLTPSTISRLERGHIRPTLEQLLPLARAYAVPLDELVAAPASADPRVHLRPFRKHGLTFVPLGMKTGGLQAYKVIYPPVSRLPPPKFHRHPGREWFYVLHGAVHLVLTGTRTELTAGEAAEFDTNVPHWIGNARDDTPAETIVLYGQQGERVHITDV